VQTGQPAVDMLGGKIPTVLAAYDFSNMGTIVDVGGGHGRLLAAMLRKWPRSRGILFVAESVVAGAPAVLDAAGVADRCTAVGDSFFGSVPSGGDAYVLKHIVHDSNALQILRNVRAAMSGGETLGHRKVRTRRRPRTPVEMLDLEMLVVATGTDRTADEYADLARAAGFRNARVIPTAGPTSIVESEAA
jgi:O-methyltransferase domain